MSLKSSGHGGLEGELGGEQLRLERGGEQRIRERLRLNSGDWRLERGGEQRLERKSTCSLPMEDGMELNKESEKSTSMDSHLQWSQWQLLDSILPTEH
nr:hypothetical protein CFP56_40173 [Quercus suber]